VQTLSEFQAFTARALKDPTLQSPASVTQREGNGKSRRFNIYRNNRATSLIDALKSSYPVLHKLTGDAFFSAAARQYIDYTPPQHPVLHEYGEQFGQYIQALPGAASVPYLEDMGNLEWARLQAYHAADEEPLSIESLQSHATESLLDLRLKHHVTACLVESRWAVGSIWSATTLGTDDHTFDASRPEAVLVTRPSLQVNLQLLDADGVSLFKHLDGACTLAEAAALCLEQNPQFDTGTHLRGLTGMGAFSSYHL